MKQWTKVIFALILFGSLAGCSPAASEQTLSKVRLDYAHYSPTSLVLKEFGWLEERLEEQGIKVEWVFSQGSNKSLEFLNSNSIDFGSTAGAAALLSKANGAPIESIYVLSQPEWTALVSTGSITDVSQLKGKKIAATSGTDPYIFLLQALSAQGISLDEVDIVNVQHGDGANALSSGQVDAWAGLDPHMARVEVERGGQLFYRNVDFNTYNLLNVRTAFLQEHPEIVQTVLETYEQARQWAIEHPEETAQLLSEDANIPIEVARIQLERTSFESSVLTSTQNETLRRAGETLLQGSFLKQDVLLDETIDALLNKDVWEGAQ